MRHCYCTLFAGALLLGAVAPPCGLRAAEPPPPAPAKKPPASLDDQLFDDLGDDPLKMLDEPAGKQPAPKGTPAPKGATAPPAGTAPGPKAAKPGMDPLDAELFRDLGGEDAGAPADADDEQDPLARLSRRMREVESRLRGGKSDADTLQRQDKIAADLAALIEELERRQQQQQQQQSKSPSSGTKSERERVEQPTGGQPGGGAPQPKPAQDSTDRVGKATAERPDPAAMDALLKNVWGELPERLRQQMLQSSVEQFLPKYELLIEDYFRTLAEEQARDR